MKRAAHADSEVLLHPNPDRDQSTGAFAHLCSGVAPGQLQPEGTELQLGCNPVLSRTGGVFRCLPSESGSCFCVAACIAARAASRRSAAARGSSSDILNFQHAAAASQLQSAGVVFTLTRRQQTRGKLFGVSTQRVSLAERGKWHRGM